MILLKNEISASPPRAPTVHSRHLKPSSPALKQDPTTEQHEIHQKLCPVVSLRGTASSWGIEDESLMGSEIKRKTMTRFMPSVIKVLRAEQFEIVAKDIERISRNVMQMVRFRTFKLDSLHHF